MAEGAIKLPTVSVLKSLINKSVTAKSKTSTINGELGEAIGKAVEDHNLHAAAFKLVSKLQRMDPVKLNAYLTHLDDYREKLELDKLAAPDLPAVGEGGGKGPMFSEPGKMKDGDGTEPKVGATTGTVQ